MKIYLASRYGRRKEMADYAELLTIMGYEITSRWLIGHPYEWTKESDPLWQGFALADFEDVDKADVVISFPTPRGGHPRGAGHHSEFGYGYAKGKMMIIIGERSNIFHHLPGVEVYSDLNAWLAREKNK